MGGGEGMGAGSLPALVLGVILAIKRMKSNPLPRYHASLSFLLRERLLAGGLDWAPSWNSGVGGRFSESLSSGVRGRSWRP